MRPITLTSTLALSLALVGCVDTTGLSSELQRGPDPQSNASGAVIVREYGDLQCPSCKGAYEMLNPQLLQAFGKQIRFEFVHFPIQSLHPWALTAAEASECAADQGKFWEFLDLTYKNQADLDSDHLRQWAQQLKLDMDTFDRCTKSHIKRKAILAEYDAASALGVRGTPTYTVNGKPVEATMDALSKAIQSALQDQISHL